MATGVRVYFAPATAPDASSYEVRRYASAAASPVVVGVVPAARAPGGFEDASGRYYFDDPAGDPDAIYRVLGETDAGIVVSDTGLFRPSGATAEDLGERVCVDHNYGAPDALRYVTAAGVGVPQALVRVYRQPDYAAGKTDLAVAVTATADDGRWVAPLFLAQGMDFVLVFSKEGSFGPDVVRITV